MSFLPNMPKTFMEILGLSVRYHFSTFRKMLLLIVFMVVVKDAYIYLGGWPRNTYLFGLAAIVVALAFIYLISAMLYVSHRILTGEPVDWRGALKSVASCFGKIVLAFLIFALLPYLFVLLAGWLAHLLITGREVAAQYTGLIVVLVIGVPLMIFYTAYFFTVPLIVIDRLAVRDAFKAAAHLAGREWRNWARVFGVYACAIAVWLLVSPDTLHGHLMKIYKVSALFDLIVFAVTLPIMMNLIVLMKNDLKLRQVVIST